MSIELGLLSVAGLLSLWLVYRTLRNKAKTLISKKAVSKKSAKKKRK